VRLCLFALATLSLACADAPAREQRPPLTVFAAASLTRPLTALRDSFQRAQDTPLLIEVGGSLELARKITELGRVPDVLMLVDDEVIAALVPTYLDWYVRFGTNRMVVAYRDEARGADSISADNWWRVLSRRDMRVGRADPKVAPVGRHALTLLQRAEAFYQQNDLADSVLARSPATLLRPTATELAALLETGEVDYILEYESVAQQYGFKYVALPTELAPPILYGVSVPRQAPSVESANRFVAFLLSDAGRRVLREWKVDVLPTPIAIGTNVPPEVIELVRTVATTAAASR
jgi:molybdate/tungstate transport system substrate-binding protein